MYRMVFLNEKCSSIISSGGTECSCACDGVSNALSGT
jgi:hypothetical protein